MGSQGGNQGKPSQSCRLYVGGVSPTAQSKHLEEIFGKYGKVLEIRMNRNFAFVQFVDEQSAQQAVTEENGKNYFGKKIDVQFARAPRGENKSSGSGDGEVQRSERERSPVRDNRERFDAVNFTRGGNRGGGRGGGVNRLSPWATDQPDSPRDLLGGGMRGGRGGGRGYRGGGGLRETEIGGGSTQQYTGGNAQQYTGGSAQQYTGGSAQQYTGGSAQQFQADFSRPSLGDSPFRGTPDAFRGANDSFRASTDPFRGGSDAFRGGMQQGEQPQVSSDTRPPNQMPKRLSTPASDRVNDIEIIVLNRAVTDYGEFIERKLKSLGFTVDVLFPNEEVPMGRVLGNIASRGTLYSVIVGAMHQQHRSLTLHILHGIPQEHRNMPIEDAVTLISRNFEVYMRQCKDKEVMPNPPPENIRHMLEQVLSGRELTITQYEKLVQYFSGLAKERRSEPSSAPEGGGTSIQEAELQNRILNILNKSGGNEVATAVPPPAQPPPGGAPLLKDPSVQKALDSLIQGDLLRKISTPHPQPPPYARF